MATATTTNSSNHHHHKYKNDDEDDDTSAAEQKLSRLRITSNNTPMSKQQQQRPTSTMNHHFQQQQLASPSEQSFSNVEKLKLNGGSNTPGRVMTASSPNLLNSNRSSNVNSKNQNIRVSTAAANVNSSSSSKKLSSLSSNNLNTSSNSNSSKSGQESPSLRKHSQTYSKFTKSREMTFANDGVSLNTTNVVYSPPTYTIVEGVADTSNLDNPVVIPQTPHNHQHPNHHHHQDSQHQPPQIRYPTRRRVSEADLRFKEQKDKRLQELDLLHTVGTGTFGRVMVARHQESKEYFALKMMSIVDVVRLKQVDHVKNEKHILEQVKHPFIVKLFWTHHSEQYLYMLLEFVPGGELFSVLRQYNRLEPKMAVFYAAEIVCALEFLHSLQIVYRDLKPENILLDIEGHLKLTDFGFAKRVTNKTFTLCGTPEYLAPEIIQQKGHNSTADWWALGVLIYEMLSGTPPFYDESTNKVYEKILQAKIEWPRHFDFTAKDIIKKFLVSDPSRRLGSGNAPSNGPPTISSSTYMPSNSSSSSLNSMASTASSSSTASSATALTSSTEFNNSSSNNSSLSTQRSRLTAGAEEIKRHRWFVSITNWDDVYNRKLKPPFRPKILHEGDTSNFEKYETPDLQRAQYATMKDLDLFYEF